MKLLILVTLIFSLSCQNSILAQNDYYSKHGYFLPTEGPVRVLLIYVNVDYSAAGCPDHNPNALDWNAGSAPFWETGGGGNYPSTNPLDADGPRPLFDVDIPSSGVPTPGTITDYYWEASPVRASLLTGV